MVDLWSAAKTGNYFKLQAILDSGTDPNLTRWSGQTALHRAASEGQTKCVYLLLQRGANVNVKAAWGWYTPLHLACRNGHEEAAELLLRSGANWKAKDKEGKTPMRWAIDGNNSVVGNKIEMIDTQLTRERIAKEAAAERQRKIKEEEERRQRQAARMAQLQAEEEAAREAEEEARQLAAEAAEIAAFCALAAAAEAKMRNAILQNELKKMKKITVEPAFYQRLREELDDEEFMELLAMTASHAEAFGLSKKQFHQLKDYARFKGIKF